MEWADQKCRCSWASPKNERYIRYHDEEWGIPVRDDSKLLEMLILESFQAGLSWECILNKREAFRQAFDQFDLEKICTYDDKIHICQNTKTPVSSVIFIISINLQSEKQPAVAIIYLFPSNPDISQSFHLEIPPACSTDDHIQLLYNL